MSAVKGEMALYHRMDTAAAFTSAAPVLGLNEFGFETDTGKYKIGDGVTAWASLSYGGIGAFVAQAAAASGGAVVTTAAALSSYGYTSAQANAIITLLNNIRAALVANGIMS